MRPWVLLRQAGIPFEEEVVRFDSFDADSNFKKTISSVSPTAKVPVLVDEELAIWDTLAIAEYVACLLYTSPSPRDGLLSRMPSSA